MISAYRADSPKKSQVMKRPDGNGNRVRVGCVLASALALMACGSAPSRPDPVPISVQQLHPKTREWITSADGWRLAACGSYVYGVETSLED